MNVLKAIFHFGDLFFEVVEHLLMENAINSWLFGRKKRVVLRRVSIIKIDVKLWLSNFFD